MGTREPRQLTRRQVLGGSFLLAASGLTLAHLGSVSATARPRLFVFVPTLIRARALSALLTSTLVDVQVTVFGRFADFKSAIVSLRPEAALSLSETLGAVGLYPTLLGTKKNEATEPYVVLTHRPNMSTSDLSKRILGMVDVVGREALPDFARQLFGLKSAPRIRRVLKTADLLPLLALNLVDGIVLPARFVAELRAQSDLPLRVLQPDGARLHRPALSLLDKKNASLRAALMRLSTELKVALDIDAWKGAE
jgi:hypothetical protein